MEFVVAAARVLDIIATTDLVHVLILTVRVLSCMPPRWLVRLE